MNESKEDFQFKKDTAEAIRQSNKTFLPSLRQMSMSMQPIALGFTQLFHFLVTAMSNNPGQPPYQYAHYPAAGMSDHDQVGIHGPVHPTGYAQDNLSYLEQGYRFDFSQTGM